MVAQYKDVINKWEAICEDHENFIVQSKNINTLLSLMENKLSELKQESDSDLSGKVEKLQNIFTERDRVSSQIVSYTNKGESLLPETATFGRELIRKELKETCER